MERNKLAAYGVLLAGTLAVGYGLLTGNKCGDIKRVETDKESVYEDRRCIPAKKGLHFFIDNKSNGHGIDAYATPASMLTGPVFDIRDAPTGIKWIAVNLEKDYAEQEGK